MNKYVVCERDQDRQIDKNSVNLDYFCVLFADSIVYNKHRMRGDFDSRLFDLRSLWIG